MATENRPLGRSRRGWEDNIRMDLRAIDVNTSDRIDDNVTRSHFWTKFRRASTTLTCPSGPTSTVGHRNRTSWEVIYGEVQ